MEEHTVFMSQESCGVVIAYRFLFASNNLFLYDAIIMTQSQSGDNTSTCLPFVHQNTPEMQLAHGYYIFDKSYCLNIASPERCYVQKT